MSKTRNEDFRKMKAFNPTLYNSIDVKELNKRVFKKHILNGSLIADTPNLSS